MATRLAGLIDKRDVVRYVASFMSSPYLCVCGGVFADLKFAIWLDVWLCRSLDISIRFQVVIQVLCSGD